MDYQYSQIKSTFLTQIVKNHLKMHNLYKNNLFTSCSTCKGNPKLKLVLESKRIESQQVLKYSL